MSLFSAFFGKNRRPSPKATSPDGMDIVAMTNAQIELEKKVKQLAKQFAERANPGDLKSILTYVLASLEETIPAPKNIKLGFDIEGETSCFRGGISDVSAALLGDERLASGEFKKAYEEFVKSNGDKQPHYWNFFQFESSRCKRVLLSIDNSNWTQNETYYVAYFKEIYLTRLTEKIFECKLKRRSTQMTT